MYPRPREIARAGSLESVIEILYYSIFDWKEIWYTRLAQEATKCSWKLRMSHIFQRSFDGTRWDRVTLRRCQSRFGHHTFLLLKYKHKLNECRINLLGTHLLTSIPVTDSSADRSSMHSIMPILFISWIGIELDSEQLPEKSQLPP